MENKKIAVVTGGNGFVGSHLVDLLLEKNFVVKCIVRETSNLKWLKGKEVEIFTSGLFDIENLKKILVNADFLFHVAGVVKSKDEGGYFKGNVKTTENLLSVLTEVNPNIEKVVIVSSQTACGPSMDGKPCDENTKPHPITTYGKSKLEEENTAKKYMDKLNITIVRAPAVYGQRDTEIYLVLKTYKNGIMTLVGFNKKLVSIIHVKDLVRGIYLAAVSKNSIGEIYFISSEKFYDWIQISKVIEKAMNKKAVILRIPHFLVYTIAAIAQFFAIFSSKAATFNLEKARDFVQQYWICDISKAKKDFGYTQEISLEDGMKQTVEWYKSEKWL